MALAGILILMIGLNRFLPSVKPRHFANLSVVGLTVALLLFNSSASALAQSQIAALGASDSTVSIDEDSLKTNPGGGHYSGLEYAKRSESYENPVSDNVIEKSIKSEIDDEVVVAVANGSVRLSGRVEDKQEAKNLISKIKEIPGVHEITFDLGLEKR
jgi:hypothetical protein